MRIVLDANVLASGVFWSGHPFRVLRLWAHDQAQVLVSEPILQEYAAVLRDLGSDQGKEHLAESWVTFVFQHASLIDVRTRVNVCRDPDDNKYLACAADGQVYLIGEDIFSFLIQGIGTAIQNIAVPLFRLLPLPMLNEVLHRGIYDATVVMPRPPLSRLYPRPHSMSIETTT